MAQAIVMEVPSVERTPSRSVVARLRRAVRGMLLALATLLVLPLVLPYRIAVLLRGRADGMFQTGSCILAMVPGLLGGMLRAAYYRLTLTRFERDAVVAFGTTFSTPEAEVGHGVHIGAFCHLGHVTFGDDTMVGSNVTVLSGKAQHATDRLDVPIRFQGGTYSRVHIGRDVWIGAGAIIADDIGDQAIVSMGAVVGRAIPPRKIVTGNPARVVGERGEAASASGAGASAP